MKKLLILLSVSVFLLTACLEKEETQEQSAPVEKKPVVATVEAKEESYSPVLEFGGSFKPFREANLSARMPGKIKKIHYREGATVPKGSVIVTLSGEMAEAAEAELEAVEKDYALMIRFMRMVRAANGTDGCRRNRNPTGESFWIVRKKPRRKRTTIRPSGNRLLLRVMPSTCLHPVLMPMLILEGLRISANRMQSPARR